MEQIPDLEEFHLKREERIIIPKINDLDVDDMIMSTPRIDVSKEEHKAFLSEEKLIKHMANLFEQLEVEDGKIIIKEKKSWSSLILQHNTVWYSSMLMLAPTLYALYFGRMFYFGIFAGLWFTSICNHHIQDYKNVINMIDRVMCQFSVWGSLGTVYYYRFSYFHYFIFTLICICYLFSLLYTTLYPNKKLWIAPHLLMHLLTITIGFTLTDECYAIRCSPITDFMTLNNSR